MERAVIWVPPGVDAVQPAADCMGHIVRHGYQFTGIIHGPWDTTAQRMMCDGDVEIVVVADPAHLPADRTPRIEVATAPARPQHVAPRRRRPRRRR